MCLCVCAMVLGVYREVFSVSTVRSDSDVYSSHALFVGKPTEPNADNIALQCVVSVYYNSLVVAVFLQRPDDIFVYTPWLGKTLCKLPNRLHCFGPLSHLLPASRKDAAYDISSVASIGLPGDQA